VVELKRQRNAHSCHHKSLPTQSIDRALLFLHHKVRFERYCTDVLLRIELIWLNGHRLIEHQLSPFSLKKFANLRQKNKQQREYGVFRILFCKFSLFFEQERAANSPSFGPPLTGLKPGKPVWPYTPAYDT